MDEETRKELRRRIWERVVDVGPTHISLAHLVDIALDVAEELFILRRG